MKKYRNGLLGIAGAGILFSGQCLFAQETLRILADQQHKNIGVAVSNIFFLSPGSHWYDPAYAPTLEKEFNMVVAENAMKPESLQPKRDEFDFRRADSLLNFADRNHMKMRGHCLVWHKQIPGWMTNPHLTRDELLQIMKKHITTVVSRYKGRIKEWDVVNEAIDMNNPDKLRITTWRTIIGPDYIDSAFVYAHRADPDAVLLYNDYDAEDMGQKSNAVYELVSHLRSKGIPVSGVGLQCHFRTGEIHFEDMEKNMKRLAALGLLTNITELDISIPSGQFGSPALQDQQAGEYGKLMAMCLRNESCHTFMIWGLSDKYSWITMESKKERGAALILNEDYSKKKAYTALLDTLRLAHK